MRRVLAVLAGIALATTAVAQDAPPPGAGPRGTSGEVHDDSVGFAALLRVSEGAVPTVRIAAMHPTLPTGSFIEVTALDTGRTIAALVVGPYHGDAVVALSPDAAQALGIGEWAGVRVRAITPSPQDQTALRTGQAAGTRLDAPPTLLIALRKKLPGRSTVGPADPPRMPRSARRVPPPETIAIHADSAPADPATGPSPAVRTSFRGGYGVQVATLSIRERAMALAGTLGGRVVPLGRLYRVQLGPFPNATAAAQARNAALRNGYRDARIFHSE